MSFTKRHYEEVARIIRTGRVYLVNYPKNPETPEKAQYLRGYGQALTRVQNDIGRMFAADNPRFDAVRFDMACEPRSEK